MEGLQKKSTIILVTALMVLIAFLLSLFLLVSVASVFCASVVLIPEVRDYQIRREVFEYVEEHKDSIELESYEYTQYFVYADWGFGDAGVIYGYYYSPREESFDSDSKYCGGYRHEGPTQYGDGWIYYEEICDHWYYYEEHYG